MKEGVVAELKCAAPRSTQVIAVRMGASHMRVWFTGKDDEEGIIDRRVVTISMFSNIQLNVSNSLKGI